MSYHPHVTFRWAAVCLLLLGSIATQLGAQHAGAFRGRSTIRRLYSTTPLDNAVVEVNRKLQDGSVRFTFDSRSGFLQSALEAMRIPVDSQLLVFSRGSLQGKRIGEQNPRALFFNDRVALGWVRGGDVLEVAASDASAGVVFYTLEQRDPGVDPNTGPAAASGVGRTPVPQFKRAFQCLGCHVTGDTLGVPGLLMFSTTRRGPSQFDGVPRHIDHGDPLEQRFGGWFVTGTAGAVRHMGNDVAALDGRSTHELTSVDGLFDGDGYRAHTSDIVAHLVLTHQAGMTNLLTRAGWEARVAEASGQKDAVAAIMTGIAHEVVDYLLFVDEAKLGGRVRGSSGFAERFSSSGPRDRKGRSLYELDLDRRLFKYPCSYLIYSPAFDALPSIVKEPIYRRMWDVLSSGGKDQRAVIEILRDTRNDLPPYFR